MSKESPNISHLLNEGSDSVVIIKKNVPSITIRKGFDFSDTYKAATIRTLDSIEKNMLSDRKKPLKVAQLQLVKVSAGKLINSYKLTLNSGLPISNEKLSSNYRINMKDVLKYRRFVINGDELLPLQTKMLTEVSQYFTFLVDTSRNNSFEIYEISISPNISEDLIYNYKGEKNRVNSNSFEFLYNENGDFIGVSVID